MPGENCAFYGCSSSRKHRLSFFKLPYVRADESEHTSQLKEHARKEWVNLILRTCVMTPDLKQRIQAGNIYICELHFMPECILTSKYCGFVLHFLR